MTRRLTAEDERLWRAMTGQAAGVDRNAVIDHHRHQVLALRGPPILIDRTWQHLYPH